MKYEAVIRYKGTYSGQTPINIRKEFDTEEQAHAFIESILDEMHFSTDKARSCFRSGFTSVNRFMTQHQYEAVYGASDKEKEETVKENDETLTERLERIWGVSNEE